MMNKVFWTAIVCGLLLALVGCAGAAGAGPKIPAVGIVAFAPDPTNDETVRGLKDGLKELGFEDGRQVRVVYQDAQGDVPTLQTIARKYVADKVNVIVPLTTPGLVATAKIVQGTDRVVVFTQVYDPYAAGVAVSPREHPANLIGVASPPPIEATIALIQRVLPNARRIGTIYNPAEANSVIGVERMRAETARLGLELVERTIAGSAEVQQAAKSLVGQADVFFITGDNTVQVSFDAVVGVAEDAHIPVFCNDPTWSERGAVVALGPDFYQAGKMAAALIAQILKGTDPATMEIQRQDSTQLVINLKAAESQGVTLPQEIIDQAAQVIGK
jgi:putative ABC transport system substrate-binding protein